MECVAHELGQITAEEYKSRVLKTLQSITGKNPKIVIRRSKNGWFPHEFNSKDGHDNGTSFALMASGLLTAGVLFVKTFSERTYSPADKEAIEI